MFFNKTKKLVEKLNADLATAQARIDQLVAEAAEAFEKQKESSGANAELRTQLENERKHRQIQVRQLELQVNLVNDAYKNALAALSKFHAELMILTSRHDQDLEEADSKLREAEE